MTARVSLAALLVVAGLLVASCVSGESSTDARVDPLFATWNRPDSPGCGIGASRNGAVLFEGGYGVANLERRAPITPSTVFHLASITKAFTAMSFLARRSSSRRGTGDALVRGTSWMVEDGG